MAGTPADGFLKSNHFATRQAQRKVSDFEIGLTLTCGEVFYQGEDRVYFLGRKRIPRTLDPETARRADGTTVVLGPGGVLVTTFKNPGFRRKLCRLSHH